MKTFYLNKKWLMMVAVAAISLSSCTHDENPTPTPTPEGKAFLSVDLQMPETARTYGLDGNANGTADESGVTSAYAVTYTDDLVTDVINLSTDAIGTVGNGVAPAADSKAFQVTEGVNKLLIVLNPSPKLLAAMHNSVGLRQNFLSGVANALEEPVQTAASQFTMLNASSLVGTDQKYLIDCTPATTATDAEAARITVNVERLAAKVTLKAAAGLTTPAGADVQILGWKLGATNKTFIPYSEIVPYTTSGGVNPGIAQYRKDANFADITTIAGLTGAFTWVTNANTTWNAVAAAEYCHENTVEATGQNFNNLTKAILEVKYSPVGVTPGASWYRYNGVIYKDFAALLTAYNNAGVGSDTRNACDAFADALGLGNNFADAGVTEAVIEAVANGGYKASQANLAADKAFVQYFQKSLCYYAVNIAHDSRVDDMQLGYWGVVRNNSYLLTVNSIIKTGTSFIPDPTDTTIKDSGNPDPTHPDDATPESYLSITITVNPWTIWSQAVDL